MTIVQQWFTVGICSLADNAGLRLPLQLDVMMHLCLYLTHNSMQGVSSSARYRCGEPLL